MLPFKKILCPTDFSEPSYDALRAANELAHHFSSELIIAHVVLPVPVVDMQVPNIGPASPEKFNVTSYEQDLVEGSKRSLNILVEERITKEVTARPLVLQGDAATQLVDAVEREGIDLLVIATHGRTGWRRFIFGSVAEKILRSVRCPVFIIHAPREEQAEV